LNTALANNNYKIYKGEPSYHTRPIYKGEISAQQPPPSLVESKFPCRTFAITPGPYLGIDPSLVTVYNNTSSVFKGLEGTVFAGYALLSSNFYLAGEIFAQHGTQITDYRNNLNNNLNSTGLKTSWGAGLSILPGLVLADTILGYLRLGAIETHFDEAAYTAPGGQVGIGIEGSVSESWDVRAEYIFTWYKSINNLGSPRSDQYRLGVLYKFWG